MSEAQRGMNPAGHARARRRHWFGPIMGGFLAVALAARTASAAPCVGDCGGDGTVDIADLITGVNIVLGTRPLSACAAFANEDGQVTIAQLIKGVNAALGGCKPIETPTAAPTPPSDATGSATATRTPTTPAPIATTPPTATRTASRTPSLTPTRTQTETATQTLSPTPSMTLSPTQTLSPTRTGTSTRTETPTKSPTPTVRVLNLGSLGPGGSVGPGAQVSVEFSLETPVQLLSIEGNLSLAGDLCFDGCTSSAGVITEQPTASPGTCLSDATIRLVAFPGSAIGAGTFLTCTIDVAIDARPGFYLITLDVQATDTDSNSAGGSVQDGVTVELPPGRSCTFDQDCQSDRCGDGICCDDPFCAFGCAPVTGACVPPTNTATPTRTETPTRTGTATWTPTVTQTPSRTGTPTPTPTNTLKPTPTATIPLSGGPAYAAPGGGGCVAGGFPSLLGGAVLTCFGLDPTAVAALYFGLRNDQTVIGETMTGAAPAPASPAVFRFGNATDDSLVYVGSTTVFDAIAGTRNVSTTLTLTLLSGTATIIATGGNPPDNANGDVGYLWRVQSSSFSIAVNVQATDAAFPAGGNSCPSVFDPTHTRNGVDADQSAVDVGFYWESLGGTPTPAITPTPAPCGQAVCAPGSQCCNALLGICAAPGKFCVQ
jgi:hypothetical protein